ncbi:hypothetical protein [Leifsonia sp. Leaf264]|uniref:hypothetical protein n=1 Tax=Leifsonia sp. Leaf264 TaxID=1736314 RepID=UPI0006FFDF30|nr:hypothetical protein [Leifsonia sp. Leaf264]KQO98354.1 hypothetical protein ASF30_09855 [Leifsonia sp. Leaf264]
MTVDETAPAAHHIPVIEHVRRALLVLVLVVGAATFLPGANDFALRIMLGAAVGGAVGLLPSSVIRPPQPPAPTFRKIGLSAAITIGTPVLLTVAHQTWLWTGPILIGAVLTLVSAGLYLLFLRRVRSHVRAMIAMMAAMDAATPAAVEDDRPKPDQG